MAKYAMIGEAEPIPQNSHSTVCDAFDCSQNNLVTSQAVPDEYKRYVAICPPRSSRSHVRLAIGRIRYLADLPSGFYEHKEKYVQKTQKFVFIYALKPISYVRPQAMLPSVRSSLFG